jgi:drug/metabolite transporter (DMT)-like permease
VQVSTNLHYLALAVSIALNGASLVLLKAFAVKREGASETQPAVTPILSRVRLLVHPLVLISMGCFGGAAVTWIVALAGVPLSVAYPSMSLIYVVIALMGQTVFGERIPPTRWAGIGLVMMGVVLMHIA